MYFNFILLTESTDERGEKTRAPREKLMTSFREYYNPKIQDPTEAQTYTLALVAG